MSDPTRTDPCIWCGSASNDCGDPRCCDECDHPYPTIREALAALHDDIAAAEAALPLMGWADPADGRWVIPSGTWAMRRHNPTDHDCRGGVPGDLYDVKDLDHIAESIIEGTIGLTTPAQNKYAGITNYPTPGDNETPMSDPTREALEHIIRLAEAIPYSADVEQAGMQAGVVIETARAALSTTPAPEDAAWAAAEVLREHQRSEVGTPDYVVDVSRSRCYLFDEGWPCNAVVLARAMLSHEARP